MPNLVRTPEQVLREIKQDLYMIRFRTTGFGGKVNRKDKATLLKWFAENLPEVLLEELGPREDSGYILGGIGILMRVAFDEKSLAEYCRVWEFEDGKSKHPGWGCFIYPYQHFLETRADRAPMEYFD